jgi:hypothetical protein
MEIKKWLPGLICAALLAAGGATSLEIARGAVQREVSQSLQITATMPSAARSSSSPAASAPASSDIDLIVKQYFFNHVSEFAPLPASPMERAKAMRQIEATIRQKLGVAQKS